MAHPTFKRLYFVSFNRRQALQLCFASTISECFIISPCNPLINTQINLKRHPYPCVKRPEVTQRLSTRSRPKTRLGELVRHSGHGGTQGRPYFCTIRW